VVSDRTPFVADADTPRGWRVRLFDRSGILWLLACVAIASTGSYYAVFAVVLVAAVALVDVAANRRWRVAVSAGIAVAAIALVALVNLLPTLVYWQVEGRNEALFRRLPYETEYEGLKVSQLLLPIKDHRVSLLADKQADSTRFTPVPSEAGQQLGVIGAIGFLGVLAALLLAGRRRRDPRDGAHDDDLAAADDGLSPPVVLRTLGVLTIASILLATVSGFSLLIAGAGFRDIRSYNRIVVYLAFAAFVAVAFGLDWIGRRLPDRPWRVPVAALGLAFVLVFGILDQVSPAWVPDYATTQARWSSDAAFVDHIERVLSDGVPLADPQSNTPAVFQLPYRYFPEAPHVGNLGPYDLVRNYLHSDDLAWSWGGVRGRGADWQLTAVGHPVDDFLDRITAVGFSGLVLDRAAQYNDAAFSEADLTKVLGPPTVSRDGEQVFWDLRAHAKDLHARLGAHGVAELRAQTLADVPHVRAQGS